MGTSIFSGWSYVWKESKRWDVGQRCFSAFRQDPFCWKRSERGPGQAGRTCQQAAERGCWSRADTRTRQAPCWQWRQKPRLCSFWRRRWQIRERRYQPENGGLQLSSPCHLWPAEQLRQIPFPSLFSSFPFIHICHVPPKLQVPWGECCLTQRHSSSRRVSRLPPPPVCDDGPNASIISRGSTCADRKTSPENDSGYQMALLPPSLCWAASYMAIFSGYSGQWVCFLPCN